MSANPELGLAAMYRFIKKSGAERVSDDAADELRKVLEEVGSKDCLAGSRPFCPRREKDNKV